MTRIAYLNGEFLPHDEARVPIEDRGLQFSDGVYEVVPLFNGKLFEFDPHYDRLERSLSELRIKNPLTREGCWGIFEALAEKNGLQEGIIYLQINRGVALRDHAFPKGDISPTVIATAKPIDMDLILKRNRDGVGVILHDDLRWARRDVKSVSLLGNILAKQAAVEAGCYEALQVDAEGFITEGTASNAWIVTAEAVLVTRKASTAILNGITRLAVIGGGLKVEERAFSAKEAKGAAEAFLTSTTSCVMPVIAIDGQPVGDGKPGPVTRAVQKAFWKMVKEQTGYSPA